MCKLKSFSEVSLFFSNERLYKVENWVDFYLFLSSFYEKNRFIFNQKDIEFFDVEKLIWLNPTDYLSKTPDQSIESEKKQLQRSFDSTKDFLRCIRYLFDNMLTTYSEKKCPITGDYMRFIAIEDSQGVRSVLLECPMCYWKQNAYGKHVEKIEGEIFPVSQAEIKSFVGK